MKVRKILTFFVVIVMLVLMGQVTTFTAMGVSVSTPSTLMNVLKSSTAQTINITTDIALTEANNPEAINLGADHTMNIPIGVTLAISGIGIDIGTHTFTVSGGGTLLINPGIITGGIHQRPFYVITDGKEHGTLNLNVNTVNVYPNITQSYFGGISVGTVNVNSGSTLNINTEGTGAVRAYELTVGGTVNVLSVDGVDIELESGSISSMLHITNGGKMHIGSSGNILLSSHATFKIEDNAHLTGDIGGGLHFVGNCTLIGLGGKLSDRGMPFDLDNAEISLELVEPEANKLSNGFYRWNGSLFYKEVYQISDDYYLRSFFTASSEAYAEVKEDVVLSTTSLYSNTFNKSKTLVIPTGKTVTIEGENGLDLDGYTLTVKGGGTLNLYVENDYTLYSSVDFYASGGLVLEDITVAVNNTNRPAIGEDYLYVGIFLKSVVIGDGATVKLNAPNAGDLLAVQGFGAEKGELIVKDGGVIVVENYKEGAIYAGVAAVTVESGGKIDIKRAGTDSIWLGAGAHLKLEEGAIFNAVENSQIRLGHLATVENMGGMFSDQGKLFTTDAPVEVNDGVEFAENQLTDGTYTWTGGLFKKYEYIIDFDLNGGSGDAPSADRHLYRESFYIPPYTGTKDGFTFIGWRTHAAGLLYKEDDEYIVDRTVTLIAQWQPAPTLTISTADQLMQFAENVNSGNSYAGQTVVLGDNINLASKTWVPIGGDYFIENNFYQNYFEGVFDGNGKTISNLTLTNEHTAQYQGFFGITSSGATVKNFTLANVNINITGTFDEHDAFDVVGHTVGGVVAFNGGTVQGVTVSSGTIKGVASVGGIVGFNADTVKDCTNNAAVTGSTYAVGGLVGYNRATIYNSSNSGNVKGDKTIQPTINSGNSTIKEGTGGVVGYHDFGKLTNVFNTGTVSQIGSNASNVGGVVGYSKSSSNEAIFNAYNQGNVSGALNVGGLVGLNEADLKNAYNSGNVTASNSSEKGGIIGEQGRDGEVSNVYYTSSIASGLSSIGSGEGGDNIGTFNSSTGKFVTPPTQAVNGQYVNDIEVALEIGAGIYNYKYVSGLYAKTWISTDSYVALPKLYDTSADPIPPVPIYSVYFNVNSNEYIGSEHTNSFGKLSALPTPTRELFTFVEWQLQNGTKVTLDTAYYANTTIYAIWRSKADIDGVDGVGVGDLQKIADESIYNKPVLSGQTNTADINGDGIINFADLAIARNSEHFGN